MYILSAFLAGVAILPLVLHVLCPYFWEDFFYLINMVWILFRFARRRKRKPLFFVLDRFLEQAAKYPTRPFIVFEEKSFTYQDTDKRSNQIARALQKHIGFKEGDTVALYMENKPSFIFTWLALAKLGCPVALLNYNIRSKSLLHCFSCCGATLLIAAAELKDAVEDVLPSLRTQGVSVFIMAKQCNSPGMESLTDKAAEASDEPLSASLREHVTFRSPAVYIYTSGTTGLPKAAVISQDRLLAAMAALASNGVISGDVIYLNLPLYHAAGFVIAFIGSIETGSTIVLRQRFSASQFWEDCRKHNVTVIQYIGEVLRYLCNTPKKDNDQEHSVRLAIGNGVRADVWREFLNRFGNIQVREFYAATEGNVGFVNYTGKIGAVGRANFFHRKLFPYALIKYDAEREEPMRDSRGLCIEASKGETGLLVSRITKIAPFVGYARNDQQTEKKRLRDVFQKGDLYFNSGDLLRIDQDNFIYFQDRVGDTFRWKGENVATTEVADVLTMMDHIQEANVYGVKVEGHEGRTGMAAITLKAGAEFDPSCTFSHVASYLPAYARPRFIRIQECLEITGTFKQKKVKLVEEGFSPASVSDPLYYMDEKGKSYIPMTQEIYNAIVSRNIKL
ncbi:very long-chain acyl-CoA synthetase-like isoform X1 [Megalops cyprinoides]|uniref:very long-chain acyl-CoA synthetase-like isoform X1 n=1 Tax=Megalops cyprinoides TaxID=118141 RepID=UPI001864AA77|nr:very long-chain acyl-CoA synthetase-like isoform X1 [Megalops cyprinoides]